jgi:thiamine kinase-like enzyme
VTRLPGFTNIVERHHNIIVRQGRPFAHRLGIDRLREASILRRIRNLDIAPELLAINTATDRTVFRAIPGKSLANGADPRTLNQTLGVLAQLHRQPAEGPRFSAAALIRRYLTLAPPNLHPLYDPFALRADQLERTAELCLCHNDCTAKNWILLPGGNVKLVDFEFAAANDPAFDLATWCLAFGVAPDDPLLRAYAPLEPSRIRAYMPIVDALWCLYCHVMATLLGEEERAAALAQLHWRASRLSGGYHATARP